MIGGKYRFGIHRLGCPAVFITSTLGTAFLVTAAQADSANTIPEIVVTAQKRAENIQDVPIAVTALSSTDLKESGVGQVEDLNVAVPALNFSTSLGTYGLPVLRGVGTFSHGPAFESPVATYIDGVYLVSSTTSLMSLADVDQISVLEGPQGTLFGRNATGGVIQITTKAPSFDPAASLSATIGNKESSQETIYVTGGLTDTLAASLAGSHDVQDAGFGMNDATGEAVGTYHQWAMRGKLLFKPDASTDVTLSVDYSRHSGSEPVLHPISVTGVGPLPGGPYDINNDQQPFQMDQEWGTSLTVRHKFDPFEILSITAYHETEARETFDADGTPVPLLTIDGVERDNQFSQELQVLSNTDGPLSWVGGLYYLYADSRNDPSYTLSSFAFIGNSASYNRSTLASWAAFLQTDYKFDEATTLTLGLRYTMDRRTEWQSDYILDGNLAIEPGSFLGDQQTAHFPHPTWRAALSHRFSPDLMAYVSYDRGYRSGTFDPNDRPSDKLGDEVIDAFEAGAKLDLFDRRLRLDSEAFYYDDKGKKILQIVQGQDYVYSANDSEMYGIDGNFSAKLTSNLKINGGYSWIHARYTNLPNGICAQYSAPNPYGNVIDLIPGCNLSGYTIENTPPWTLSIGPSYNVSTEAGDVTLSANFYHNGGWYAQAGNLSSQSPYNTVAASVTFVPAAYENLSIRLWGRNLTDKVYANQLSETSTGINATQAPGRMVGITVGVDL